MDTCGVLFNIIFISMFVIKAHETVQFIRNQLQFILL